MEPKCLLLGLRVEGACRGQQPDSALPFRMPHVSPAMCGKEPSPTKMPTTTRGQHQQSPCVVSRYFFSFHCSIACRHVTGCHGLFLLHALCKERFAEAN